ncbi:MAG: DUF885 family protein [Myxococcota bacterium]
MKIAWTALFTSSFSVLCGCSSHYTAEPHAGRMSSDADRQVDALTEALWQATMERYPTWATDIGDRRYDDRLEDISLEAQRAWSKQQKDFLKRLQELANEQLSPDRWVTAKVLSESLTNELALETCATDTWSVDQLSGYPLTIPRTASIQVIDSPAAAQNYLKRFGAFAHLMQQHVANLQRGLAAGFSALKVNVERVIEQLKAMLQESVERSPYAQAPERAKGLNGAQKLPLKPKS